jgi:nickel-dependent lactate racemase
VDEVAVSATAPETVIGVGHDARMLTASEVRRVVARGLRQLDPSGKRLLVIIPDHSRSGPVDRVFRLLYEGLAEKAAALDYLIALGTHPPMTQDMIYRRVGITEDEHRREFAKVRFFNHLWKDPNALTQVGTLSRQEVSEVTGGLFEMEVPITINRMVFDYDLLLIVGPVFPHEVVGFSGGNKYLFPGIAGQQIIDFFHWLGAVITNPVIIGNKCTPVRRVVDRAAAMLSVPRYAFSMVVKDEDLAGLHFGTPEESWSAAADLSAKLHIVYKDHPYHTVLSCAPEMYDDIWTAGKCMYKLEPVVADGGTLIIYAPHIKEVSVSHGRIIEEVGYHTRDCLLKQWDKYQDYPWGVLAHCTHVKGIGSYDAGVERPRVNVVLATRIPPEVCARINLGYLDPATINPADYAGREDEGILCVPKAGETLYRLANAPPELGGPS